MAESITVTGLKEVQKSLYSYSQQLGDRVVKGSLRLGANVVLKQARIYAPIRTGKLKSSIQVANSRKYRGRLSTDLIGVYLYIKTGKIKSGKRKGQDGAFYGRFQEDGWNTHGKTNNSRFSKKIKGFTRRSVDSSRTTMPGKTNVPGKKFIDRAFIEKRAEAVDVIVRAATAGAEVLARKLGL